MGNFSRIQTKGVGFMQEMKPKTPETVDEKNLDPTKKGAKSKQKQT